MLISYFSKIIKPLVKLLGIKNYIKNTNGSVWSN